MKLKVYTRFLNLTSLCLNWCIKFNQWSLVAKLLEFRKNHIAKTLRYEIKSSS